MSEKQKKGAEKKKEEKPKTKKLVVIRIRGVTGIRKDIKDTLDMLRLYKKHFCVVLRSDKPTVGMIKKVKDYVTWGEISEEALKELKKKREAKYADNTPKPFFRLHPPIGGFERKGIKKPFSIGGVLGDRKQKIDDLLKKMM
ncbi:50S ribosomal protein L30 [Candidatus Woesearchaeota archaeon]|nr:50S ribosomal protein L30 [Candidatus Woesearchaeota archaeon]